MEAHSSGLGQGSEFTVRLPLAAEDSAAVERPLRADQQPRTGLCQQRILVVDDNRDAADTLGMLLKYLGADTHVVYDGPSGLDALRIYRPAVVFLDIGMPSMDGHEVARRIRQEPEFRHVMLIAMTGWGQEEDRRRSTEAGFDHHLVKPAKLEVLQTLLASPAVKQGEAI